ncbi:MAG: T9SS type A sorting domain-containing protein [Bacteroides sp.]
MKRLVLVATTLLFAATATFGQTVLKEKTHGLLPGNPNPMIETEFSTPGAAGEGVVWDFSALPQKAAFYGHVEEPITYNPPVEAAKSNTLLIEDNLEAFMTTNANELRVLANRVGTFVRTFEKPVLKMRYPFAYGDRFAERTPASIYYTNSDFTQKFVLDYSVEADAYGTLLLPGTTLKNVLRVVTTHSYIYDNNYTSTVVTYRWYVKSHRYPVLSLIFEKRNDGTLYPLKGAYNAVVEVPEILAKAEKEGKGAVTTLNLYPNPFSAELNVKYTLSARTNVTIALYNAQGLLVKTLLQQNQEEGAYTSTFTNEVQSIPAGMYVLRVEANGGVLSQQVVKVQ